MTTLDCCGVKSSVAATSDQTSGSSVTALRPAVSWKVGFLRRRAMPVPQKSGASNQGRSWNPRQGAYGTCPGRRPFRGAATKALLPYRELAGFPRSSVLTLARHFRLSPARKAGPTPWIIRGPKAVALLVDGPPLLPPMEFSLVVGPAVPMLAPVIRNPECKERRAAWTAFRLNKSTERVMRISKKHIAGS